METHFIRYMPNQKYHIDHRDAQCARAIELGYARIRPGTTTRLHSIDIEATLEQGEVIAANLHQGLTIQPSQICKNCRNTLLTNLRKRYR